MVKLIFLFVSGVEVSQYKSGERLNSTCMIKNLTLLKLNAIIFSVNVLEREKLSSIVLVNQVLLSRSKSGLFSLYSMSAVSLKKLRRFTSEADTFNWFSVVFAGCVNRWPNTPRCRRCFLYVTVSFPENFVVVADPLT